MIGVAGRDGPGAVDLFGEHGSDHEMRPGHGAEGQSGVGTLQDGGVQPLGAADQEADSAGVGQPSFQQFAEAQTVRHFAALVEGDDESVGGERGQEGGGFAALDLGRGAAGFGDFGHREGRAQARVVAGEEFGVGAVAQAADGDQVHGIFRLAVWRSGITAGVGRT